MKTALQQLSLVLIVCAVLENVLPPSKGKRAFHLFCALVIFVTLAALLHGTDLPDLHMEEWTLPSQAKQELQ